MKTILEIIIENSAEEAKSNLQQMDSAVVIEAFGREKDIKKRYMFLEKIRIIMGEAYTRLMVSAIEYEENKQR